MGKKENILLHAKFYNFNGFETSRTTLLKVFVQVVPVAAYPSYPVGVGYPSSYGMGGMGGIGAGMPMNYGTYPQQTGYPVYEIYRPEGPMKRFWKGAADGVIQGSLGWLG